MKEVKHAAIFYSRVPSGLSELLLTKVNLTSYRILLVVFTTLKLYISETVPPVLLCGKVRTGKTTKNRSQRAKTGSEKGLQNRGRKRAPP